MENHENCIFCKIIAGTIPCQKVYEDEEVFDYIEFILSRDEDNTFLVVSSTFSDNGNYLKLYGKDVVQARKVIIEKYFHLRTVLL